MRSYSRLLFAGAAALTALSAQPSMATVLQQPGYSLDTIATLNNFGVAGELQVQPNGDIWIISHQNNVALYRLSADGTTQTTIASAGSGNWWATLIEGETAWVGDTSRLYRVDLNGSFPAAPTLVRDFGRGMRSIERFPSNWGPHAGKLLLTTQSGLVAYDAINDTEIEISPQAASSAVFTETGDLLLADYNNNRILKMTPDLTVTTYFGGISVPDGLAYHPGTGKLYVTQSSAAQILEIGAGGIGIASFATAAYFSGGTAPSHIGFNSDFTRLYWIDINNDTVESTAGFPAYISQDGSESDAGAGIPIAGLGGLLLLGAGFARRVSR